jgi:hypothetical protein
VRRRMNSHIYIAEGAHRVRDGRPGRDRITFPLNFYHLTAFLPFTDSGLSHRGFPVPSVRPPSFSTAD